MPENEAEARHEAGCVMRPQLFVGRQKPSVEQMARAPGMPSPLGDFEYKPVGLWTSTFDPQYGSAWVQWCLAESFKLPAHDQWQCWLLMPMADARVLILDDPEMARYSLSPNEEPGPWAVDWNKVSECWDAAHLTEGGQEQLRFMLWGWDCESTVWFHWAFDKVVDLGLCSFEAIEGDHSARAAYRAVRKAKEAEGG